MMTTTTVAKWVVRVTGLIQIVLGLLFWTGNALDLVNIHMVSGLVLVIALWVLAATAGFAGVSPGPVALAAIWGLLVIALGLTQTGLLVGDLHWVIQVLHLLVGLGAIGQAEGLAGRIRSARPQAA